MTPSMTPKAGALGCRADGGQRILDCPDSTQSAEHHEVMANMSGSGISWAVATGSAVARKAASGIGSWLWSPASQACQVMYCDSDADDRNELVPRKSRTVSYSEGFCDAPEDTANPQNGEPDRPTPARTPVGDMEGSTSSTWSGPSVTRQALRRAHLHVRSDDKVP
mmetsp:Transcript_15259/g.34100  ORF Transcript_15259/g.34100 Transcript_15259/m.34100 type:complete len:166 (-) Transcript_15259:31-528(-)